MKENDEDSDDEGVMFHSVPTGCVPVRVGKPVAEPPLPVKRYIRDLENEPHLVWETLRRVLLRFQNFTSMGGGKRSVSLLR